jgi:hypothetical protein
LRRVLPWFRVPVSWSPANRINVNWSGFKNHHVQGQVAVLSSECVLGREQELHARLQPLLLFFIDGASVIDLEDEDWDLLLAVQTLPGKAPVVVSPHCTCAALDDVLG